MLAVKSSVLSRLSGVLASFFHGLSLVWKYFAHALAKSLFDFFFLYSLKTGQIFL